jgi:hypothetical protein
MLPFGFGSMGVANTLLDHSDDTIFNVGPVKDWGYVPAVEGGIVDITTKEVVGALPGYSIGSGMAIGDIFIPSARAETETLERTFTLTPTGDNFSQKILSNKPLLIGIGVSVSLIVLLMALRSGK